MGLFDRFRKPPPDVALEAIFERIRAGDSQGALAAITAKLERIAARVGNGAPEYAAVLFEHATVCLALGMTTRAIASMRTASAIRGPAEEDEKNRLTYLMNLSEALATTGALDEAMQAAEEGLAQREQFYGQDHPGYAYGLETVAEVALALGRYGEALKHAQSALAVYDKHAHFKVPHAWALVFLGAAGNQGRWTELQMGPEMASAVLEQLCARSVPVAPEVERVAIETLAPLAASQDVVIRAWQQLAGRARTAKDHATRAVALERLRELADLREDPGLALEAELGLALAHDERGDGAAAGQGYERAERRARTAGSAAGLCCTLRNAGLFFVRNAPERGLALLREATEISDAPPDENARSRIALGIQLQHRRDLAAARQLLASGLPILDPAHPDAICGRSHLRAIEEHGSCECTGTASEIQAQIERMVSECLPPGLLEAVEFGDGEVSIRVSRALDEREARLVADATDLAMAGMRKRFSQTYGD